MEAAGQAAVKRTFDAVSGDYERVGPEFFNVFGRTLVDKANLRAGMRVLDLGCGTGAVLVPAAEEVAPDGHVRGIDLAPGMIDRVNQTIAHRGWDHVRAHVGDAEDPPGSPGEWDRVLASQVLAFLPAPKRAVARCYEILKPGGVLALTSWGPGNPELAPVSKALYAMIPAESVPKIMLSGSAFDSDMRVSMLLQAARFTHVRHETLTHHIIYSDPHEYLEWTRSHGSRALWDAIPRDKVDESRAAAAAVLDTMRADDGTLRLAISVRYSIATRP